MDMANQKDFKVVFKRLKELIEPYEPDLVVTEDTPEVYSVSSPVVPELNKDMFFAAVRLGKSYVSYYLMPVYLYPELLDTLSPGLRKRMQGKSCFNFSNVDDGLLDELTWLTEASFERFKPVYLPQG
jgi:hypothetical protein